MGSFDIVNLFWKIYYTHVASEEERSATFSQYRIFYFLLFLKISNPISLCLWSIYLNDRCDDLFHTVMLKVKIKVSWLFLIFLKFFTYFITFSLNDGYSFQWTRNNILMRYTFILLVQTSLTFWFLIPFPLINA